MDQDKAFQVITSKDEIVSADFEDFLKSKGHNATASELLAIVRRFDAIGDKVVTR
jgi:Ca2+-binding EF-hand superfamily protein